MDTTKTALDGETHVTLSHDQQHKIGRELQATLCEPDLAALSEQRHRRGVPSLHPRLDERASAWRELADTVAERAAPLRYPPDGHPGAVAETSEEPAAHGALAGPDVVQLPTRCPIGAVRALMQLGMVRVEGAS